MWNEPAENLPHALLLLGDQIHSHRPPLDTLDFIRSHRDTDDPPGEAAANYEEYARLYQDSWGDPTIRWLLSTVPSAMIFDDHEVGDDWNISESWVEEMRQKPWWDEQIIGALASYWIYQHLGNLSPQELAKDDLFEKVKAADDAGPLLLNFAYKMHRATAGTRWSFYRDFGNVRLMMVDSRGGQVLERGYRSMVGADEWDWIEEHSNRRLRPPPARDLGTVSARTRHALSASLERGRLLGGLGEAGDEMGGEDPTLS